MTVSYGVGPGPGKPQPTRADVLTAAEALLVAEGPEALSMRRLAAALGTSYQVVYSRVGSKADVVRALHAEGFRRLGRSVVDVDPTPGTEDHLVAVGTSYLATAADHPTMFEVMFGTPIVEFTRDADAKAVEWACFSATWVAASRAWLDVRYDPRPKGASVRLAWRLWTAVHGITVLHLAGHDSPSGDVRTEVATVVRALLVDPLA